MLPSTDGFAGKEEEEDDTRTHRTVCTKMKIGAMIKQEDEPNHDATWIPISCQKKKEMTPLGRVGRGGKKGSAMLEGEEEERKKKGGMRRREGG